MNDYGYDHSYDFHLPDLTPLIDVIFILIVFFLLTPSISERAIKVDLPQSGSGTLQAASEAMVSVDSDNQIFFRNNPVDINELPGLLRDAHNENPSSDRIIVESDKNSTFGIIVRIMDYASMAGFEAVSFTVTDNP